MTSAGGAAHSRTVHARAALALTAVVLITGLSACTTPSAQEVQDEHRAEAEAAASELEDQLAVVGDVGTFLGSSVRDACTTGQHNWKVDDDYDVICTVEVSQAYLVTGSDFREAAEQVSATFPGCESGESETEATLRDYWDTLEGTQTHNFEGPYRPDYLPSYRLACADAPLSEPEYAVSGWVSLPVDEESATLHGTELGLPCHSSEASPCTLTGATAQEAWDRAEGEGWVVFVTGATAYSRVG